MTDIINTTRTCSLSSSSSGNCIFISGGGANILIDAGISAKGIKDRLACLNVQLQDIDAIFITHEHIDHVKALDVISKNYNIPIYMNGGTYRALSAACRENIRPNVKSVSNAGICIGNLIVKVFPTPHDSAASLGYTVWQGERKLAGIATDIGYVSEAVSEALCGCHVVYIESNYDTQRLKQGSYPPDLKRRILSDHGHLSNKDCAEFLPKLINSGVKNIILYHLSKDNNTVTLAFSEAMKAVAESGCDYADVVIQVAPPSELSETVYFYDNYDDLITKSS